MQIYQVPMQLDTEEKLFGGVFTLKKMIYIIVCVGIGAMFFIALYRSNMEVGALIWGLFSILGWFLGFFKVKNEYDVDRYILMRLRYSTLTKNWPFIGGGGSSES